MAPKGQDEHRSPRSPDEGTVWVDWRGRTDNRYRQYNPSNLSSVQIAATATDTDGGIDASSLSSYMSNMSVSEPDMDMAGEQEYDENYAINHVPPSFDSAGTNDTEATLRNDMDGRRMGPVGHKPPSPEPVRYPAPQSLTAESLEQHNALLRQMYAPNLETWADVSGPTYARHTAPPVTYSMVAHRSKASVYSDVSLGWNMMPAPVHGENVTEDIKFAGTRFDDQPAGPYPYGSPYLRFD